MLQKDRKLKIYWKRKENRKMMLERIDYIVARMDGDYAYLQQVEDPSAEEKCVARALLSLEIYEGCRVKYEMLSYEML